jgi:UDP-2-acetamido-2,6-beta-L-arabino-hexul-4-ose reductase
MNLLITGAAGFIGMNLQAFFRTEEDINVLCSFHDTDEEALRSFVFSADWIIHLAGANRPEEISEFSETNVGFTSTLCALAAATGRMIPIIFTSSIQASLDNPYGQSKREGENVLHKYSTDTGSPVYILRLANVFGKWCRPNYNSVVATFCHKISHGQHIEIHDPDSELTLVHIDDVIRVIKGIVNSDSTQASREANFVNVSPEYRLKVGELANKIRGYHESRQTLMMGSVGSGLDRALYATYLSYLDQDNFSYALKSHEDERGKFVEVLKTRDSGQFSFLTAHPGVTRGMHYHHTKSEKFLVVKGRATFRFRQLYSNEVIEIETSDSEPRVVETIPGWIHDITNTGNDELIVMLWANEIFDPDAPDTIFEKF